MKLYFTDEFLIMYNYKMTSDGENITDQDNS